MRFTKRQKRRLMQKRGHSRVLYYLAIATMLVLCAIPGAQAWSNGGYSSNPANPDYGTHDWIADAAMQMQTKDVAFLKTTFHASFLLGTEAPDNPHYIGDSGNHHVYYFSNGDLQDDACAVRASAIYSSAVQYLKGQDYELAAFETGVMAHYISDVGVFGHTMGSSTDWGSENHHSDYEGEMNSIVSSLAFPIDISLGNKSARNATLELAENITFGEGAIMSNVWMDANYDWTNSVFEASAMASLYASVAAVAAAINHLMVEAAPSPLIPLPEVPQPPASLTASVEGSHVVLTWALPPSDGGAAITGYEIYRGTNPDIPSHMASVSGTANSWNDESVEKGKTYYYWVVAENSVGPSGMSQVVSVTVPGDPSSLVLPIAVSSISIALASGGVLLWLRKKRGKPLS